MPITLYPGSMKKRNANGSYSDLVPAIATDPEVLDDFAEEYSTSETYNIGDYCIHNSDLYKCNTNDTTGTWNNNAWDRVTVGDELVDHKNTLNKLVPSRLVGKQIAIYADSWASDYHGSYGADYIGSYTGKPVHVVADPGATMQRIYNDDMDNYVADIYIVSAGINDFYGNVLISSYLNYAKLIRDTLRTANPNAEIYFVTPPMIRPSEIHQKLFPIEAYRIAIWRMAAVYGWNVINGLKWTDVALENDKIHPIVADADKIGKHVVAALCNYGDEETHIDDYTNMYSMQSGLYLRTFNGGFQLKFEAFDVSPDPSEGNEATIAFPLSSGVDFDGTIITTMSGTITPIYVFHGMANANLKLFRPSGVGSGNFYISQLIVPIELTPLSWTSQS